MGEKTKAQLTKELEASKRQEKWIDNQLKECQAKNRILSGDIERAKKGWVINLHEQTLTGDYQALKQIAKQLIDSGFWFFELRKD